MKITIDTTDYPVLEQNGFQTISLNERNLPDYKPGLIRAYKDVFNASAWREWVKCSSECGYKTTFEEAPNVCPDCFWNIEDYYSDAEITDSVLFVMKKTYFQCLVLINGDDVAGFTWWWNDTLSNINQEKLGLPDKEWEYQQLIENLTGNGISSTDNWYYQSEVGIVPKYRTRWVGKALVSINEEILQSNKDKINAIILRTSKESPMNKISRSLWYTEVYSYNDTDKRVLFAKNNF